MKTTKFGLLLFVFSMVSMLYAQQTIVLQQGVVGYNGYSWMNMVNPEHYTNDYFGYPILAAARYEC